MCLSPKRYSANFGLQVLRHALMVAYPHNLVLWCSCSCGKLLFAQIKTVQLGTEVTKTSTPDACAP